MSILDIFKNKKSPFSRVAVIGLGGMPASLLQDLAARGIMPAMAKLFEQGHACAMDTTMPPVPSVAWPSFMTGMNPAMHGIFGFMERRRESSGIYFPNANQLQSPTLWDMLTDAGKTTVAVNIPQTYPARPTNGVIISGPVALDLEQAVYPASLVNALRKMDYRIDADYALPDVRKESFFKELFSTLKKRRDICLYLRDKISWHLFICVFTGPDQLLRYFWDDLANAASPWHRTILDYYRALDTVLEEMTHQLGDTTALMMLSDHGYDHLEKEFFINAWLQHDGYLSLTRDPARSFEDIDMGKTTAFALDPGRIHVNVRDVMPRGIVDPGEDYDALIKKLAKKLLSLRDEETGQAIIAKVYRKEKLYAGPFSDKAPDLVLCGAKGYGINGSITSTEILGKGNCTGRTTHDDAFFYLRNSPELSIKPHIQDLAPTILQLLGLPLTLDMDGKPLL